MYGRVSFGLLAALTACGSASGEAPASIPQPDSWTQVCEDWDDWDKPAPPFRIHGNSWHVGTCGISAILTTDPEGHVLLDGGTQAGADVIAANIRSLGLDIGDIGLIGFSHEHFDHVGGIAKLQELSGAVLVASPLAAPVMESGIASDKDPQSGIVDPFTPAQVDFLQEDGEGMGVGDTFLLSIATPGHTPGAMSWQWESCDLNGDCLHIVYADSLSPISEDGYRFSDHPAYVQSYRDGLARLAALDCDILLTPHPSASGMRDKLLSGDLTQGPNCADYAAGVETRLNARLAEEAAEIQ